jgi:hypothetical protein
VASKQFVEIATFGQWDPVRVEDAVGTTHPKRCPFVFSQSTEYSHFEHDVRNPAFGLTYRPRGSHLTVLESGIRVSTIDFRSAKIEGYSAVRGIKE